MRLRCANSISAFFVGSARSGRPRSWRSPERSRARLHGPASFCARSMKTRATSWIERRSLRGHEDARDFAREIAKTEAYQTSRYQRKRVEMLFAHLKRILKLDRLRLRGPCGARDEFHLAAIAQNLRKLAKLIPAPELISAA